MDNSLILGFNGPGLLPLLDIEPDPSFNWVLLSADVRELSGTDAIFELGGFLSIGQVL